MTDTNANSSTPVHHYAIYVLAFSIFAMAFALVYFTVQISSISDQIPEILESVESTSAKIEPVVTEIDKVTELVPPILEEIKQTRKQIPLILKEVESTRKQIPAILTEVGEIRAQLPSVLEEVKQTREMVPDVLDTVNTVSKEVEKTRLLVPQVLTQVELTREAIPGMMDRADNMITQARAAGREASKGAVTGVLTGIVAAPFNLIGGLGKKVLGISAEEQKKLTDKDIAIMTEKGQELLASNEVNTVLEWQNPDDKHNGKMTLKKITGSGTESGDCKDIQWQVLENGKKILFDKQITYCLDGENGWQPKS